MVELATLQAISYIMGSLGVFVAAIYYVLNIQNNRRNLRARIVEALWPRFYGRRMSV